MRQIALNDTASFDLPIMVRDGVEVMSSVDLAKMCGQTHSDFLKKVPKVLNGGQVKFYSSYLNAQNKAQPCYYFPRRESCLMAMSYSYELQAHVYDCWHDLETSKPKPVEQCSPFTDLARVLADKKALAELFGLSGNQALLSASRATELMTGFNPANLIGIELKADRKEKIFTVTELGKEFFDGMSARKLNVLFAEAGLQEKIGKHWELTEAGKVHAELLDTGKAHSDGTPVKQIKWFSSATHAVESL